MKIKPKKSLGQNFLRDDQILQKIIASAELSSDDFVIEVGPGEGVLTEQLAKYAKKVVAIELDNNLVPILEEKFSETKNIEIIHNDILKINLPELLEAEGSTFGSPKVEPSDALQSYKVIANIPYYITSPIIRLFLEQTNQPKEIILLVQKEVAQRIVAKPGRQSILAASVQYYGAAEILFEVNKKSFFPIPKVDSAVIKIIPQKSFDKELDKKFFRIVKAGFSAKRKTLLNTFSSSLQLDKNIVEEKLKSAGISPAARAQELSIGQWEVLVKLFDK